MKVAARELRLSELLGKPIHTPGGRVFAHLEEIRVAPRGEEYVVTQYVGGPAGYLEQLGLFLRNIAVLRALPFGRHVRVRTLRWQWVDVSDPARLRMVPTRPPGTAPVEGRRAPRRRRSGR